MTCSNQIGLKNILIGFEDCSTGQIIAPILHKLSSDSLPEIRMCTEKLDAMTGGYSKRVEDNASIKALKVIREANVPLSYYQGCASLRIQLEYYNGRIITGIGGSVIGDNGSDTHEVELEVIWDLLEEMLPGASLAVAA